MNTQSLAFTLVTILATIIPTSLIMWIICGAGSSSSQDQESPVRWFLAIFLPVYIVMKALRRRSLDLTAGLCALVIGFILTLSSYCFSAGLLLFFYSSIRLTRYKASEKRKFEEDYHESGQRNWTQVVCNGGVAGQMALLYLMERGSGGEIAVNFSYDYSSSWFAMAVLGAIACSCGDTWASEIGSVYSDTDPYLVFSFQKVPRGTNGAVSLVGLVASFAGGTAVGTAFYLMTVIFVPRDVLYLSPIQMPVIAVGGLAGLFGSLLDSFLGANFQFSGEDMVTHKIVQTPGDRVRWISGTALLDNHSVNLISSLLTALLTPRIAQIVWSYYDPVSVLYS